jgi:hypothetical protein
MSILFILNLFNIDCLYAKYWFYLKNIDCLLYIKHWVLEEGVYKVGYMQKLLDNLQYRIIRQLYAFPFFLALN